MKTLTGLTLCFLFLAATSLQAGIIVLDDVTPSTAAEWSSSTNGAGTIGDTAGGSITVSAGDDIYSGGTTIIGDDAGVTGTATITGTGSTWTIGAYNLFAGNNGTGYLNIEDEASVTVGGNIYLAGKENSAGYLNLSDSASLSTTMLFISNKSTGVATVDNSIVTTTLHTFIGSKGTGTLNIINGGVVNTVDKAIVGQDVTYNAQGTVNVTGAGSIWTCNDIYLGYPLSYQLSSVDPGTAMLNISDGGLALAGTLRIDYDQDGDSYVNMKTGGMLALPGDLDDSLSTFLGAVTGDANINYWTGSAWSDITNATSGDYTLTTETLSLNGTSGTYTVLTVGTAVPEPSTIVLLLGGLLSLAIFRRVKK